MALVKANVEASTSNQSDTDPFSDVALNPVQGNLPEVRQSQELAAGPTNGYSQAYSEEQLAAEGFEGLDIGFRSFKTIRLETDGLFTSNGGDQLGKQFRAKVMSTKPRWTYKPTPEDKANQKEGMFFSYDQKTTQKGETVEEAKARVLAIRGLDGNLKYTGVECKRYLDVVVEVVDAPGLAGEWCVLSISPTSCDPVQGVFKRLIMTRGPEGFRNTVLTFKVGAKVTQNVIQPFYPWSVST